MFGKDRKIAKDQKWKARPYGAGLYGIAGWMDQWIACRVDV